MVSKLVQRKERQSGVIPSQSRDDGKVSDTELFARSGNQIKVVKRGD